MDSCNISRGSEGELYFYQTQNINDDKLNILEDDKDRYYYYPHQKDWFYHSINKPFTNKLILDSVPINYDFARNPFDHLLFCVTNRRNIVCDYCFKGFNMHKIKEPDYDDLKNIADSFLKRASHKETIQFTGDEVFVKKNIDKWFEYLHKSD